MGGSGWQNDGPFTIGGIECATVDGCIEQVRNTPIADGDALLVPTYPVEGCWFHPSAAERVAREAGLTDPLYEHTWYECFPIAHIPEHNLAT